MTALRKKGAPQFRAFVAGTGARDHPHRIHFGLVFVCQIIVDHGILRDRVVGKTPPPPNPAPSPSLPSFKKLQFGLLSPDPRCDFNSTSIWPQCEPKSIKHSIQVDPDENAVPPQRTPNRSQLDYTLTQHRSQVDPSLNPHEAPK